MKIRTGFVSNSSSSSFMIGIGVIKDRDKVNKFLAELPLEMIGDEIRLIDLEEEMQKSWSDISFNNKSISVMAPVNDTFEVFLNDEDRESVKNGEVVVLCLGNNEGDGEFWIQDGENEWDGYMDWDVDLSHYSKDQQKLFEGFSEENGFVFVDKTYGAARNG